MRRREKEVGPAGVSYDDGLRYIFFVASLDINRRVFCIQLSMALAASSAFAQPISPAEEAPVRVPPERAEDTYAILSLLVAKLETTKREFLIPDTTEDLDRNYGTGHPVTSPKEWLAVGGGSIVEVPKDQLAQFNEGLTDIAARRRQRLRLEPKFNLLLPYRMMDSAQRAEYDQLTPPVVVDVCHPWKLDKKIARKYKGRGPLSLFSQIYFDRSQTLGMVWALGDGYEGWNIYEKRDGTWHPVPWKISMSRTYA